MSLIMGVFILIGVSLATLILYYVWYLNTYWSRRGIPHLKPKFIGGIDGEMNKYFFAQLSQRIYNRITGPFAGYYLFVRPIFYIKDLDLIKQVLIKDFDHFVNRGMPVNEDADPLTGNLFNIENERWRFLRNKLSPTFTSGKLKQMFPHIAKIGVRLQEYVAKRGPDNDIYEAKQLMACYSNDVITSVAFGIETDSINNPQDKFRKMGERALHSDSSIQTIRETVAFCSPTLAKYLKIRSFDPELAKFMRTVTEQSLDLRENQKVVRHDFLQLLVKLRNGNTVNDNDPWSTEIVDEKHKQLTVNEAMAQIFIFFLGGFETSSTVVSFALFEIAKNKEVQTRLHQEIDEVLKKHDGKLTYESINDMKYLEQVIDESMRRYPPATALFRSVTKPYKIPNHDIVLQKDELVLIDMYAIQNDPKYFPNPNEFNPDRFSPEEKPKIIPFTYMPFGDGPRNCIGSRMGLMQSKLGLFSIMSKYNVELAPTTAREAEFVPLENTYVVAGGLNLRITPRIK